MQDESNYRLVKKIFENKELVREMEKQNPGITSQMAGYLLSPWLPIGWQRKVVMLCIFILAIALGIRNPVWLLLLVILPCFSPRFIGEIAVFFGRLK